MIFILLDPTVYMWHVKKWCVYAHVSACMVIPFLEDGPALNHCPLLMHISTQIAQCLLGVTALAHSKC